MCRIVSQWDASYVGRVRDRTLVADARVDALILTLRVAQIIKDDIGTLPVVVHAAIDQHFVLGVQSWQPTRLAQRV